MKKCTLLFILSMFSIIGYAQTFDSTDYQIIHLQDTLISGTTLLHFKMTTNNNTYNSGYSDFTFIDQNGDTITQPTNWSMGMPVSNNAVFDTVIYLLNYKVGINSFPTNFNGHLKIKNPDCTIPFNYIALSAPSINQELESINIYPNPSIDKLFISNVSAIKIDLIQIYNIYGELLPIGLLLNNYIDISNLPQGIYFVKIFSNHNYKTFKVQKI